jgi:hypothetical protein
MNKLLYIPIGILGLIGFIFGGIGAGCLLLMDVCIDKINKGKEKK